jgi:hypothetical protein
MRILMRLLKLLAVVAAVAACAWMTPRLGPWKTIVIFAVVMNALCGAVAFLVHRQPPGKVTIANYVMAIVLPWGYQVGRGQLSRIVFISWAIWVLLGLATVVATSRRIAQPPASVVTSDQNLPRSATIMTLLAVAWIVDGAVLLRCIGVLATGTNRGHMSRSMAPLVLFLVAILAISIALVTLSHSATSAWLALLVAGGPPLFVAAGYGLFMLVILTIGRNARWN